MFLLCYFLILCESQIEIQVNNEPFVTADNIAHGVYLSRVSNNDVIHLEITKGVVMRNELINSTSSISKVYVNLTFFAVVKDGRIENDTLPSSLFKHCHKIQEVAIDNLETVERDSFYNSTHLINFRSSTLKNVEINAFRFCGMLTMLELPSVVKIASYGFMNCTNLTSIMIPNVEFLGSNAFYYCISLKKLSLPKCRVIKTECFKESGIVDIQLSDKLAYLGSGAFYNATNLSCEINLAQVSHLSADTFMNCIKLKNVNAPDVVDVDDSCFYNCSALEKLNAPQANSFGYQSFFNTKNLSMISFPSIKNVGSFCFWKSNLRQFDAAGTLEHVGQQAFRDCGNLCFANIGKEVIINYQSFDNCVNLETLRSNSPIMSVNNFGFRNCLKLKYIDLSNVKLFGNYSFSNVKLLENINSSFLEYIGDHSFELTAIQTFSSGSAKYIGSYAFNKCEKLTHVSVLSSCTHLEETAFSGCPLISQVTLFCDVENVSKINKIFSKNKLVSLQISTKFTELVLGLEPHATVSVSKINGYCPSSEYTYTFQKGTTKIEDGALKDCNIQSIKMPDTVTHIGNSAFEGNTFLDKIDLPPKLITLGEKSLKDCVYITVLKVPFPVQTLGDGFVSGCLSLVTVDLLCIAKSLGKNSFTNCPNLKVVLISTLIEKSEATVNKDTIVSLSNYEGMCPMKNEIHVPSFVTDIMNNAYDGCIIVQSVQISANVRRIMNRAFFNLVNLIEVKFDEASHVTTFDDETFASCVNLEYIRLPSSLVTVGSNIFYGDVKLKTIEISPNFDLDKYYDNLHNGTNASIHTYSSPTFSPSETSSADDDGHKKLSSVAIISITVSAFFVVAIVVLVVIFCVIPKMNKHNNNGQPESLQTLIN